MRVFVMVKAGKDSDDAKPYFAMLGKVGNVWKEVNLSPNQIAILDGSIFEVRLTDPRASSRGRRVVIGDPIPVPTGKRK